ncbi:uncharacterized protein N0V89_001835 [Didymosphaeria variabile]|uniref:NADAR domain-containing protein n=1 Tax=Didymosphaeria variabile TaxID=1932322 RepID=A0A9W9CDT6_9PLEO|nr:uncharacterized protein N0V89_001835 [Didymosphaeria variabile]KAJ4357260.1 hypothetical protein N0V89_001835 [Didymosphaeria variabile]
MARTKRKTAATAKTAKDSSIKTRARKAPGSKTKSNIKGKTSASKKEPPVTPTIQTIFFWKETDKVTGFLCPWYKSKFHKEGVAYQSAGQYIMAEKARLFRDTKTLERILASTSAEEHKSLGNSVKGFKHSIWHEKAYTIACQANKQKFLRGANSRRLRVKLLPFVDYELVYASPVDHYFGIGISAEEAASTDRKLWGRNLLGQSLWWPKKRTESLANPEPPSPAQDFDVSIFDRPGSGFCVNW